MSISGASTFTPKDAFVGYQSDTSASIVFTVQQDLKLNDATLTEGQWEDEVIKYYCICIYTYISICLLGFVLTMA